MSLTKTPFKQTTKSLAAALLTTTFMAANANAQSSDIKVGECQDRAKVEAVLAQEGQKVLFVGKRITDNSPSNAFYINEKGYGYNIEFKKATNELCTRLSYKEVVLNSADNSQVPAWALGIKPNKGIDIQKMYAQTGEDTSRLVFVARAYEKNASGNEVDGKAIVVSATPLVKVAGVWSVDSNGMPKTIFDMKDFGIITKNFDDYLSVNKNPSAPALK